MLYRLSYPAAFGLGHAPTQVIATTHSPYLLDQFRDHPEEIVIAQKSGRSATFERLIDRPDLDELLREGSLGDMWFAGLLGGVPEKGSPRLPRKKGITAREVYYRVLKSPQAERISRLLEQKFAGGNRANGVIPTRRSLRIFTEGTEGNEDLFLTNVSRFVLFVIFC